MHCNLTDTAIITSTILNVDFRILKHTTWWTKT